jgi:hypothetical protein
LPADHDESRLWHSVAGRNPAAARERTRRPHTPAARPSPDPCPIEEGETVLLTKQAGGNIPPALPRRGTGGG